MNSEKFTSITSCGKLAILATCMPKLWSHIPGFILYNKVNLLLSTRAVTCWFLTVDISSSNLVISWKCVAKRQ